MRRILIVRAFIVGVVGLAVLTFLTYNYTGFLLLPCGMIAAGIVAFSRGWDRASKGGRIGVSRGHPSLL